MTEKIKEKVLEFSSIAKECPENLQVKCFELLLSHYLNDIATKAKKKDDSILEKVDPLVEAGTLIEDVKKSKQEDIVETDLHVKVRSFLQKNGLTIAHINQIFYKEGDEFKPLYDDLKTTQSAESQMRISLLIALRSAIQNGDFKFEGEIVRKEAQERKCYDAANFAAIFKKNKQYFDGFTAYDKNNLTITLSTEGKQRLAEIIKELQ